MYAIRAVYDGTDFKPKDPIPFTEEYNVVITFTAPVNHPKNEQKRFSKGEKDIISKSLFGVLPSNIDLDEARSERLR